LHPEGQAKGKAKAKGKGKAKATAKAKAKAQAKGKAKASSPAKASPAKSSPGGSAKRKASSPEAAYVAKQETWSNHKLVKAIIGSVRTYMQAKSSVTGKFHLMTEITAKKASNHFELMSTLLDLAVKHSYSKEQCKAWRDANLPDA
jgi:hypothetical protein